LGPAEIRDGRFPEETAAVRSLILAYADELGEDLCFQSFDQEMATLPGKYAPPCGALLVAEQDGALIGLVALRPLDVEPLACEMKRMYVEPAHRGSGLGRRLAEEIIFRAKDVGYTAMYLDTLPHLASAIKLYEELGFVRVEPYYENNISGAVFMRLEL
jgi:GNAT superfamily N-acetyltransferase